MRLCTSQMRDTDSTVSMQEVVMFWEQLIPVQKLNSVNFNNLRCTYLFVHDTMLRLMYSHVFRVDGCECSVPKGKYK